jgi:hypothetical protein
MRKHNWIYPVLMNLAMMSAPAFSQTPAHYTISGEIRDEAGRLAPGAQACAQLDKRMICVSSDRNGRYVITLWEEGRYTVNVRAVPARPNPSLFLPKDEYPAFTGNIVMLNDAHRDAHIDLQYPQRNGMLLVKAVDGTNQIPIELILVQVCPAGEPLRCGGSLFRSDTGQYKIFVPAYPYNLSIRSPDYQEWVQFDAQNPIVNPGSSKNLYVEMMPQFGAFANSLEDKNWQLSPLLAAPVQVAPAVNAKFAQYPRTTTLHWNPVEGAALYAVEVDYCQSSQNLNECLQPNPLIFSFDAPSKPLSQSTTVETTFTFNFVGAQPGRWRVWAVDKNGRKGLKSPWRLFVYAR